MRQLLTLFTWMAAIIWLAGLSRYSVSAESSTTLPITQIVIEAFEPYPSLGITEDAVNQLLNTWLEKLGPHLTMQQLYSISDEITRFYRAQGLMMARASIPPQDIVDTSVKMVITPGTLGEVVVSGDHFTKAKSIARPFLPLTHQTIQKESIQIALQQVENLPGLDVFSYFSMGQNPGETRINLKIITEDPWPWQASVRSDNHGGINSGEYRAILNYRVSNLTGHTEDYQIGLLQTLSEAQESTTLGFINMSFPFFHPQLKMSWYLSNSQFSLGNDFEILEIQGQGHETQLKWQFQNLLTHTSSRELTAELGYYDNKVSSDIIADTVNTALSTYTLGSKLKQSWLSETHFHSLSVQITTGKNTYEVLPLTGRSQDEYFTKMRLRHQSQWYIDDRQSWQINTTQSIDWSQQRLPGTHQTNLSGPNLNRGFLPGEASADSAYTLQLKLLTPAQLQFFRPFLWLDYSYGKENAFSNTLAAFDSSRFSLASFGGGLLFQKSQLSSELYIGYGFHHTQYNSDNTQENLAPSDPTQIYFTMNYAWD